MDYLPNSSGNSTSSWPGAYNSRLPTIAGFGVKTISYGLPMAVTTSSAMSDFASISSGGWDSAIQAFYAACKSNGFTKVFVRPGWEMNLSGQYAWQIMTTSGAPAAFVSAFQHIYTLSKTWATSNGVSIIVAWNPNVGTGVGVPYMNFFPGASHCDQIWIDMYGSPYNADTIASHRSGGSTDVAFIDMYNMAQSGGNGFGLGETSSTNTTFPTNLTNTITANNIHINQLGIYVWSGSEWDWTANSSIAAAWKSCWAVA
jgi:hypothetical protein